MSGEEIRTPTDADWQTLRTNLKFELCRLKTSLENTYSQEFYRLTDHEEDTKHDAITQLHVIFHENFEPFFVNFNLRPDITVEGFPQWALNFRDETKNNGGIQRTVFQLINQLMLVL